MEFTNAPLRFDNPPIPFDVIAGNNDLYEFENNGEKYIYKQLKRSNAIDDSLEGSVSERATKLNKLFRLIKRYYGDLVVDTHYLVAQDTNGNANIITLQKKIEGQPLNEFYNNSNIYQKYRDFKKHCETIWENQVIKDEQFGKLDNDVKKFFITPDFYAGNIIYTPEGRFVIVDW